MHIFFRAEPNLQHQRCLPLSLPANWLFAVTDQALMPVSFSVLPVVLKSCHVLLQPNLWPPERPLLISRNVTIATANFSQAAGNYAHMSLEYTEGRVVIEPNVTVTVRDIALTKARRTSGQGIPFFVGACHGSALVQMPLLGVLCLQECQISSWHAWHIIRQASSQLQVGYDADSS
jgi:hypothetical protein